MTVRQYVLSKRYLYRSDTAASNRGEKQRSGGRSFALSGAAAVRRRQVGHRGPRDIESEAVRIANIAAWVGWFFFNPFAACGQEALLRGGDIRHEEFEYRAVTGATLDIKTKRASFK